jgi:hypothetical protein
VPVATTKKLQVSRQFGLVEVGKLPNVREEYFILMLDREREEHPSLQLLREQLGVEHRGAGKARPR